MFWTLRALESLVDSMRISTMFTPTKLVCHQTICKSISLERPQYTEKSNLLFTIRNFWLTWYKLSFSMNRSTISFVFPTSDCSRYTYTLFFWRLKKFWTIVLALWWRFFFFWASFIPNLSFFRICRIKVWKTSSTKCLRAADVSKNGQSNSLANAWPSSVVTSLLLSKSILFATRTIGVPSPLRTRSICVFAWAASRKLCLSVMEYIMTNPSPLRIYCSLMAVNSCYKLNKNNFVICYWY